MITTGDVRLDGRNYQEVAFRTPLSRQNWRYRVVRDNKPLRKGVILYTRHEFGNYLGNVGSFLWQLRRTAGQAWAGARVDCYSYYGIRQFMDKSSKVNFKANVVDAGARYGLHPTWAEYEDIFDFSLFEPDPSEATRLDDKYSKKDNIVINNKALSDSLGSVTFYMRKHKALNSSLKPNDELIEMDGYKSEEQEITGSSGVEATTIENHFSGQNLDFLKLDVEGAELDVLRGAGKMLTSSVLAVRAEVCFAPVIKDGPLFGDLNTFMTDNDFILLNLDYDGRGVPSSAYTMPERFGLLISTDAVWIKPLHTLLEGSEEEVLRKTVIMSLFLLNNNGSDTAVQILLNACDKRNINISKHSGDPVVFQLQKKICALFKSLSYLPQMNADDLACSYLTIFREEFPTMNDFYESRFFV